MFAFVNPLTWWSVLVHGKSAGVFDASSQKSDAHVEASP